jgi:SP family general alpha glucoside:H+ symporter-like MFS transporter
MASHNKPVTTTASVGAGNLDADDGSIRRASVAFHDVVELHPDATQATDNEHKMTLKQALKLYPKAVAWSMLFSTAILMEGYDVALLSSFYALPQFNEKYGALADDGAYTIPAPWKSGLSNGALCGEILGLFATGMIAERLGYRKTMLLALTMMIAVIFVSFFAPSLPVLLLGEILCGIPWYVDICGNMQHVLN